MLATATANHLYQPLTNIYEKYYIYDRVNYE